MGLKEKRAVQTFKNESFPALEAEINNKAGFNVSLNIAWDTLVEDKFSHLYNDTFPKIYFQPLIEAIKAVNIDEIGGELLKNGLKEVKIVNENNEHNLERAITFVDGVLTINHSPIMNADKVEEKTERIVHLLETHLEEFAGSEASVESTENPNNIVGGKVDNTIKLSLPQLHNQYVALAFEKQDNLADIVEDLPWTCDMLQGTVTYGDLTFKMQVLGTYSHNEKSWLWAWANKQSGIPEQFLEASLQMKALGERQGIEDLLSSKIETEHDPGHYFSFVATGVNQASCYAPLPFKGLTVYVLLYTDIVDEKEINIPALICSHFSKTTTRMDFEHKHALFCYLVQKGYEVEVSGNNIVAKKGEDQILGIFDLKGRLLKLSNSTVPVGA
ncbi:DUF6882 domain-containing protein [Tenacibaculum singaporense]|uniref:DUF6882 domain-containing protein n=1 Tax=Tenacibaculum singaporense TaxID=2358479 RepID=UPI001981230B|nr:DUF6882 domain-containing protein [Tenacibaculum singaporense]